MGEFDLSLIVEFRSRPCLYDRNSSQFKDKLYTAQQWQEISNKLGYDVSILKDRMLQLRNRYNLEKRRIEQLREKSPHKFITSPWLMYENLQFLSDHIKARRRYKNMLPLSGKTKEEHFRFLHDSVNDYSALGTDDAALEAAQDEANRLLAGQQHQPFPNALLAVKVEENLSDQASDAETDPSHNNESETNLFGDNCNIMPDGHSLGKTRQDLSKLKSDKHQQPHEQQQQHHQQQHHHQQQQQYQQQQRLQNQVHQQLVLRQQQSHQQSHPHPQLQLKQQFTAQRNHSTPISNGMIRNSIGSGNDSENLLFLQRRRHSSKRRSQTTDNDSKQNDAKRMSSMSAMAMAASFMNKSMPIKRLSPRELKYNAFGNFVSSSLMDLPQKMALELIEKFTSDTVKALKMKMDSTDESPNVTDVRNDK